jgi:hypothetical protein
MDLDPSLRLSREALRIAQFQATATSRMTMAAGTASINRGTHRSSLPIVIWEQGLAVRKTHRN